MSIWQDIDAQICEFEKSIPIPNETLENVDWVIVKSANDLLKIPKAGGCYWIWTDRDIHHSFNNKRHPAKFDSGEIIYNGIAKDDVRGRVQKHLVGHPEEGFSAISVDLYPNSNVESHKKKACSAKGNSAYFNQQRIRNKNYLANLNFSPEEITFIDSEEGAEFYFRNGINVTDAKHVNNTYKVYFICDLKSLSYGDIIEKRWREKYGLPRLCTYNKGR